MSDIFMVIDILLMWLLLIALAVLLLCVLWAMISSVVLKAKGYNNDLRLPIENVESAYENEIKIRERLGYLQISFKARGLLGDSDTVSDLIRKIKNYDLSLHNLEVLNDVLQIKVGIFRITCSQDKRNV
ncbi:hypothetical protein [Salibacterium aidingense]|uniref:hypothetical protein n=1 Tax=Salibacterium aidingense TaxID=384933 RepID=UPI00047A4562|nr:hypothetical protein [Salibacterium aidingense]